MPDARRHRGAAPKDDQLFGADVVPVLRQAVFELSWLLSRGYPEDATLALVGNRHALVARQRRAVARAACADEARDSRLAKRRALADLAGEELHVDGFNCVILSESILSGAPVFGGRDGALRDLASVHGTWRRVSETGRAIASLARLIDIAEPTSVTWWLDRPVSNSGRLAGMLREARPGWQVELVDHVDPVIAEQRGVVASADAYVLDRCEAWIDLPRELASGTRGWIVELGGPDEPGVL